MASDTTPRQRRSVSKARLFKEIRAAVTVHNLTTASTTVQELLDAIKDDIVEEAIGE